MIINLNKIDSDSKIEEIHKFIETVNFQSDKNLN
jgi:hypothetical protein